MFKVFNRGNSSINYYENYRYRIFRTNQSSVDIVWQWIKKKKKCSETIITINLCGIILFLCAALGYAFCVVMKSAEKNIVFWKFSIQTFYKTIPIISCITDIIMIKIK